MTDILDVFQRAIAELRSGFSVDPRTDIFEVRAREQGASIEISGAVSIRGVIPTLHERLMHVAAGKPVINRVVEVSSAGMQPRPFGLVTSAIAPMLAGPLVSESQISQLLLGETVLVLREEGRWLQCRAPDGYLGWVHRGYLLRVEEKEALAWERGDRGELHLALEAQMVDEAGASLTRLPWGARVSVSDGRAFLPDGREGRLIGETVPASERNQRFPAVAEKLVSTARVWLGSPYLWGGRTLSGVDCSGFVQAIFGTYGIPLPRDSDQQAAMGALIPVPPPADEGTDCASGDITSKGLAPDGAAPDGLASGPSETDPPARDFRGFRPGDLLFFAEPGHRVSHVAISTGGSGVIHSAVGRGGVAENDLAGKTDYERELRTRLVNARRLIRREL
ncbi:MAG: C40 family peptidase [Gemmatimonadota bacterium]|jgi:SH3-like domain-containing protein|nr:C40 family peptidase [Gemmatimonadota bacterium]